VGLGLEVVLRSTIANPCEITTNCQVYFLLGNSWCPRNPSVLHCHPKLFCSLRDRIECLHFRLPDSSDVARQFFLQYLSCTTHCLQHNSFQPENSLNPRHHEVSAPSYLIPQILMSVLWSKSGCFLHYSQITRVLAMLHWISCWLPLIAIFCCFFWDFFAIYHPATLQPIFHNEIRSHILIQHWTQAFFMLR
jgi:hypothetical protein